MKNIFSEHIPSILFVSLVLTALFLWLRPGREGNLPVPEQIQSYLEQDFIDFDKPFQRALLHDMLRIYEPEKEAAHDSLLKAIDSYRQKQLHGYVSRHGQRAGLGNLLRMYLKFALIYILLMALIYYGVQTFAVYRFARYRQGASLFDELVGAIKNKPLLINGKNRLRFLGYILKTLLKMLFSALVYLMLFSPAYVLAYSIKSDFNTNSDIFILLLGLFSNGLLVTYTNKFFIFLKTESRKGYVQTARVKNLDNDYTIKKGRVLSLASLLAFRKSFAGHVFEHIFMNARRQYISAIKEQATFLVSGLIIIEMALNIHGRFSYELLRQLLYKNYDSVIIIVAGIFYLIKLTEIFADYLLEKEEKKIAN